MEDVNVCLLRSVYTGAETGYESTRELMSRVEDDNLREAMRKHSLTYDRLKQEAERGLMNLGREPREPGSMQKLGMKLGIEMQTAMDASCSHVAELMMKGSNMGVINMTKAMNSFPDAIPGVKDLCRRFVAAEQDNIRRMSGFLQ